MADDHAQTEASKESAQVFHAFVSHPQALFEGQTDSEYIILLLRAHPITQIPWVINSIFLLIIIGVLNLFLPLFLNMREILFFNIFLISVDLGYVWFNFLSWYFNVGIITNERIVDIDFSGILYKEVSATRLNKIEDVTDKTGGYLRSLFNFGHVYVQTAGTEENIEFIDVPFPSRVVRVINDLMGPNPNL